MIPSILAPIFVFAVVVTFWSAAVLSCSDGVSMGLPICLLPVFFLVSVLFAYLLCATRQASRNVIAPVSGFIESTIANDCRS